MDKTQREAALVLWKQEPERPTKRFGETYLTFWKMVFEQMQTLHAPHAVLMHALSDDIKFDEKYGKAVIYCTEDVKDFIEANLDAGFRTIFQQYLFKPRGVSNLHYQLCPP